MGIFSDMETGHLILIVVVIGAMIFFGGKNVFRDDGGKGGKGGKGGSSGGSSDSGGSDGAAQ